MEDDGRDLQPIKIGQQMVENGRERFTKDRHYQAPATFLHRNNLTALSQRYNLYFIAHGSEIAVYRPSFPFQTLGNKAILTIPPSLANPAARGYLDQTISNAYHGINHLIVGDLGSEEILLVATDTGNIAAYHTRSIEQVVERKGPDSATASTNYVGVRAFFTNWVQESAWGLAIHKHARMIAVSSNTPHHVPSEDECAKITIFAFALSSGKEGDGNDSLSDAETAEWHRWTPNTTSSVQPDRLLNLKIDLGGPNGHRANIPNISFVNSSEDRPGNWLLSTDIDGEVKAWQIWRRSCYKTWDYTTSSYFGMLRQRWNYAGWSVLALDPLAFRIAESLTEFCGKSKAPIYHGYKDGGDSFDLTNIVRTQVPGNNHFHPSDSSFETDGDREELEEREQVADWLDDDEPLVPTDVEMLQQPENRSVNHVRQLFSEVVVEHPVPNHAEVEAAETRREAENEVQTQQENGNSFENQYDATPVVFNANSDDESEAFVEDEELSAVMSDFSTTSVSDVEHRFDADEADGERQTVLPDGDEEEPDLTPEYTRNRGFRKSRQLSKDIEKVYQRADERSVQHSSGPLPAIPLIYCSAFHIRMFNGLASSSPHLYCANILKQEVPDFLAPVAHLDRLNLTQQIPELGIVIIASQFGRCAVCTLTKRSQDDVRGLRVDWVLPTEKQERSDQRPALPLLGITAGPIQGRMNRDRTSLVSQEMNTDMVPRDQVLNGVLRTFDHDVVVLGGETTPESDHTKPLSGHQSANEYPQQSPSSGSYSMKRKRSQSPQAGAIVGLDRTPKIEQRAWMRQQKTESWRGIENSRRYRLMLTYYDHTVLTYEIWREAGEIGVLAGREGSKKSMRNRDPLF